MLNTSALSQFCIIVETNGKLSKFVNLVTALPEVSVTFPETFMGWICRPILNSKSILDLIFDTLFCLNQI